MKSECVLQYTSVYLCVVIRSLNDIQQFTNYLLMIIKD